MQPVCADAVKALNGQGVADFAVARRQGQHACFCDVDAGLGGQGHGGVLDQWRIDGIIEFAELDDARPVVGLQQCLGPCAAQCHAGLNQALCCGRQRGLRLQVFNRAGQRGKLVQRRVGLQAAGQVLLARGRNAQRAETVITSKQQHFQDGQPGRPVNVPDDALAPSVWPRVVDGAGCAASHAAAEQLPFDDRQVFTERKIPPAGRIREGGAVAHQLRQLQFTDQHRAGRVDECPDVQLVLRHVGARVHARFHARCFHALGGFVFDSRAARPAALAALSAEGPMARPPMRGLATMLVSTACWLADRLAFRRERALVTSRSSDA